VPEALAAILERHTRDRQIDFSRMGPGPREMSPRIDRSYIHPAAWRRSFGRRADLGRGTKIFWPAIGGSLFYWSSRGMMSRKGDISALRLRDPYERVTWSFPVVCASVCVCVRG
jgi:hypothetical protein